MPFTAIAMAVAGCGGCSGDPDGYPATFTFRERTDPVVVELPKDLPRDLQAEPNGQIDDGIRRINQRAGKVVEPADVPANIRTELTAYLTQTFGTPAAPTIASDDESRALAQTLGLTDDNLAAGSKLYRSRCQDCHGADGDGRGGTGLWLNPHPRDFRQGAFKFTTAPGDGPRKPSRDDLFHTLTNGLKTTGMPSFALRTAEERQRLIDYVMYLSLRGRVEFQVLKTVLVEGEDGLDGDVASEAGAIFKAELRAWAAAQTPPTAVSAVPDATEEAVRRGLGVFVNEKKGACATCHEDFGRTGRLQYDVWGTLVRPANLTEPRRKSSDTPEALFRRVRGGIHPSNMPANTTISEAEVWDLVHFLKALPYPDRLPADVRDRVYPR